MKKILFISAIWCPTCLIMRSRYMKFVNDYDGWTFEEVDFDQNKAMIESLKVGIILPVAIIYHNDKEVNRLIGEITIKKLTKTLGLI